MNEEEKPCAGEIQAASSEAQANPCPVPRSENCDDAFARLEEIAKGVASLQKAVSGYYTSNTDAMHRELEKYRTGLFRRMEQNVFGDVISLLDSAESAVSRARRNPDEALQLLEGLREEIEGALFNRGVERREAARGEKFDPRRHHVVRPDVPVGNASLDGTVAETAKSGFDDMDESFSDLRGGCMKLRPVWVRLFRYDPSLAEQSDPASADSSSQT